MLKTERIPKTPQKRTKKGTFNQNNTNRGPPTGTKGLKSSTVGRIKGKKP
jgi:hypothetical protein